MKNIFSKNKTAVKSRTKNEKLRDLPLLILSGILFGISFPPFPFPFQILMFFALVPYLIVIERRRKLLDINKATFVTFFVASVITLYWVGSWQEKADTFLMISGVLLLFVNPLLFFIPSTLLYFARKIFKPSIALFLFPVFWVTYEYLYMITDLSFPWLIIGSGLSQFNKFIQAADIIGAPGISLAVVLINILLVKAIKSFNSKFGSPYPYIVWTVSIVLVFLMYGFYRYFTFELSYEKIKIGVVQPNIDPWDKWGEGGLQDMTDLYLGLSQKAINEGAQIVIWPETALPVYLFGGSYGSTVSRIYNFVKKNNVYLLTGIPDILYYDNKADAPDDVRYNESGDFYYRTNNAIILVSPHSYQLQRYGKMKLVPFGERVPFVDVLPFLGDWIKWGVGISGWNKGNKKKLFKIPFTNMNYPNRENDTLKINGLVCYESIYPYFVSDFVHKGADLLVVVTNDSWYGNSSGPYQHKEFSVLRAIENRKSVIRAANGGISCVINPLGETEIATNMFEKTYFVYDVTIQYGDTFFTNYSMVIPVLSSLFSLWIIGISVLRKIKEKFNL